jgi:hypothetical protein
MLTCIKELEFGKGIIKTIAISHPNILGTCMPKDIRLYLYSQIVGN